MRPILALVVGAVGFSVACMASHTVQVSGPPSTRVRIGELVQVPTGIVSAVGPTGLVQVRVRVRETGDLTLDVATLECDPTLLRVVKQ